MSVAAQIHAAYQNSNPELDWNEDLINWRSQDDTAGYLEDIFKALEVIPGITFKGLRIERDESKFPRDLVTNDIDASRLDLAFVHFNLKMQENDQDITLQIFLPKLIDGLFYQLKGNLFYPILQLVDRGTYVTRKTFTLKTMYMPIMLRRDAHATLQDINGGPERTEMLFILDLFRNKINVFKYFMAKFGLHGTLEYFGVQDHIGIYNRDEAEGSDPQEWRCHEISGSSGLVVAAPVEWVNENPHYHGSLIATLVDALNGLQRRQIEEDDLSQWRRRLGRNFTQNSNSFEEKADKIIVSLERLLDNRTCKNLAHVDPKDKEDVYGILRWMMREYRQLMTIDSMDVRNKRIRMAEYIIHPLLLKFSESTYRLLNSKTLTFRSLLSIFKAFMYEEGKTRPQANFLIKRLVGNELLRYSNMVNSMDLLPALRWTIRGPQSLSEGGKGDIALRYRGHHPSYVGRIGLCAASAGDPGTSGTMTPFCQTKGQFFK